MGRAASRLPAQTASPAGDRMHHLRPAVAIPTREATRHRPHRRSPPTSRRCEGRARPAIAKAHVAGPPSAAPRPRRPGSGRWWSHSPTPAQPSTRPPPWPPSGWPTSETRSSRPAAGEPSAAAGSTSRQSRPIKRPEWNQLLMRASGREVDPRLEGSSPATVRSGAGSSSSLIKIAAGTDNHDNGSRTGTPRRRRGS